MAKKQDKDLLQTLRGAGLRKRVATLLRDSADQGKRPSMISRSVKNLRTAAKELENRGDGSKRNAAKRSATARKAAKTRARAK